MQTTGSKAQVWHGTAKHTSGGLTKNNLMKNKHGRIISKKKHNLGKKSIKHLKKLGYIAKKGKFQLFHKHSARGRSRKMRGGMNQPSTTGTNSSVSGTNSSVTGTNVNAAVAGQKPMKGGMAYGGPLLPQSYKGQGEGTSGVALQIIAGNAG
jgi:hypothetical protein